MLGRDLLAGDEATAPATNRERQVGVLLAALMHLAALDEAGVTAAASLGQSLGEYAHLVHIGALDAGAALRLVDARGALYDEGPPGKMAAVFPMAADVLAAALRPVAGVEIVNLNSPNQNVIAGPPDAVDRALELLDRDHIVETVVIERRVAMHSAGFAGVAERFRPHLERAPWRAPRLAYRPNVDASVIAAPSARDFVERLHQHVHRPVLWRRSVERCAADHASAVFVEVGPGRVLSNLLQRRWLANRKLSTDGGGDPRAAIQEIAHELHGG